MQTLPREIVLTLPGCPDPAVAVAACRAGALGVLDLEYERHLPRAIESLSRLASHARAPFGVKLDADAETFTLAVVDALPREIRAVLLAGVDPSAIERTARCFHDRGVVILIEARSIADAETAQRINAAGIVAKGIEAGGRIGEETTFILLQRLLAESNGREPLPIWAHGGIGTHTAAACVAAGAAGVVLDWQLALTREAAAPGGLPASIRARIQGLDGSETLCVGGGLGDRAAGAATRLYARPAFAPVEKLQALEERLAVQEGEGDAARELREAIVAAVGDPDPESRVWLMGQDAAFAPRLAKQFRTVGGVIEGIRRAVERHLLAARALRPLDEGTPLARSHGTRYPILQGPMTRVSDVASFAAAVAQEGALPFLALALMRAQEVEQVLRETRERMGDRPWGIGILGFVPLDLRKEQLEAISAVRPPFALIAGGRPDQAHALERRGIPTYLHVPSPGLLKMFLEQGARRFVFEGRECGGHVGPRTSFVLWQTMIDVLMESTPPGEFESLYVVFAGGIHDARSAAAVSALAAPLAEKGVKLGALMGTAYLFTQEAVSTGAIRPGFQEEARQCRRTVLLETAPGHSTRCVDTAFAREFLARKRDLRAKGRSAEEIRDDLEMLNLGRLRIASKGITRVSGNGGTEAVRYACVDDAQQRAQGMYMIGQLAELRHEVGSIATLHHEVAVGGSEWLAAIDAPRVATSRPEQAPCDVAIVGMGCFLPKAKDLPTFWENVLGKVDAITEVPPDRWDWRRYFDPDRKAADKIYSRWGGFLDDVPFDPLRYGMPPNTLASIEPMQLLALEVVRATLLDAGYLDREFDRARTSVIFGAGGGMADLGAQYALRAHIPMFLPDAPPEVYEKLPKWTEDSFAGILPNVAAGRVANRFDFGGVNYTVDAACASSLAAVYQAVRELGTGHSDMVIVGGLDTMQNPFTYLCFAKTQALSPQGCCRTFDAQADGIVISEGVVALALKRLADAERDGDRIYAVIKGVGGSSDGRDRGLTAPRPEGQVRALERAYAQANVSPATVGLFEAHGTGTVAGDQAEAESLNKILRAHGARPSSCALGSVKSMIGHTKCAAGVTGLMKIALALHEKILPPTLNVERPNPKSGFGEGPLFVNTESRPWIAPKGHPRRAGVSAFGFGGTNFHAVLEEHPACIMPAERVGRAWPSELLVWSGADRADILAQTEPLARALAEGTAPSLADLAFTTALERASRKGAEAGGVTLSIVADSISDLAKKLTRAADHLRTAPRNRIEDPCGIYFADRPLARDGRVAFLYPGQGSQAPDMLRELALHFPEVREAFERADGILDGRMGVCLSRQVFPPPRFTPEEECAARAALTDTRVAQPALGAAGVAVTALLDRFGVRPELTAGHSYGEYVALWAAGRIDERTLLEISEARGRAIAEASEEDLGAMAATDAPREKIERALQAIEGITLANLNAPRQTVLSGPRESVEKAVARLEELGHVARHIPVACAFHSPLVAPARDRLSRALDSILIGEGSREVYSNALAAPYPADPKEARALLTDHLVKPVRFQEEIEAMHAAGARIFVEAGPGAILTGLTRQILEGRDFVATPVDNGKRSGLLQLQHALGLLVAHGVPVAVERLYEGRTLCRVEVGSLAGARAEGLQHLWLVNGRRVRPMRPAPVADPPAPSPNSSTSRTPPPSVAPPEPVGPIPKLPLRAASRAGGPPESSMIDRFHPAAPPAPRDEFDVGTAAPSERATVMLQYQSLMARFLETQRSVMLAYLGASAVEQRPLPRPERRPLRLQAAPAPSLAQRANVEPVAPPAPPPASEPSGNGAEGNVLTLGVVTQRLLTIVSDRTGYPPEMLNLDLDLEADLGIDSIKRVEILGTFQTWELLSGWKPDDEFMEKLRGHKTLRSIAAFLFETIGGPSPGPDAPGPSAGPPGRGAPPGEEGASHRAAGSKPNGHDREVEETASLDAQEAPGDGPETAPRPSDAPRFVLRLVPSPLPATAREGAAQAVSRADGLIVITDDEGGTAEAVRDRIANLGGRAVVIPAEGAEETLARMRRSEGKIGGVLHLAPLSRATPFDALDHDGWRARITVEAKALHTIVRAVGADLRGGVASGTPFLLAATEEVAASPHRGAVHGLVKCLAWEWPGVLVRAVDFEGEATPAGRAEILLSELAAGGEERVAFWRGDRRAAERPTASPLGLAVDAIDPGAVILVTGGARGITAAIARAIAAHAKATLVITGRSPRPPMEDPADIAHAHSPVALRAALLARAREEGRAATPREIEGRIARILADREIRENLRIMQDAGARVVYRTADARDSVAMGAVIEETYAAFGRIDGAIHGAGVIEDKLLEEKGADSFDRVFDTKADAAFLLARTLRPEGLRFLAFMSSVAGAFGNRGQADYGAANETLNRLATWLDARLSTRVVAINWGPWDAGMATPEVKRQFEARGVRVIPIESGCAAFLDEIASGSKGDPVVVIGEGPWAALAPLEDAPTPGSPATPLLHRERLSMAEGGKLACVRVLDPAFDRYLHHHRLEGKPVLPAAAALALMAEAAQQAWPDLVVTGARDVRVLRGITLRERTLPVRISVRAQTHAPTEATDEVLAAVEITEPESVHRAYYRATILLGTHLPEGPAARHPFLATLPPYPMPIGDAYRKWLFHGPVFQCVRRVLGVSEEGILSEIFPSRPSSCLEGTGDAARWTIDPVLVDGCLQLALLWVRAIHDVTGLPSRMRVVRRYAFDPGTPLTVSLRVLEGSGEANVRSDILCLTPEGKTAFAIDGFEFTCSAALNRLVGWDESLLPPSERGNP